MTEQPIKILIVEDDELDRMIIKRALKGSGINCEVTFAEDHESGKEATDGKNYDCIFLDYNLPGGTGLELLKEIRQQGNTSPIIIVTSHGDEKVAVEAMKSGASDYIPKSLLTPEGLAQSLRYVLRFKESEREKQRIEHALQETERRLQKVVSNSPIILFALDVSGNFTLFEGKGVENLGVDKTRMIGKSIHTYSKIFPEVVDSFERTIKGEEVNITHEFQEKFFQSYYSPIRNSENEIIGIIGVSTDITDHKRVEEELKKAKILAEETAMIKEQFLANMSHEIRTPLNGIIGLTHILLNTKLDDEQSGYMKSIKISSDNLLIVINDVLDFSKIEAGRMNFETVPFRVEEVAKHTVDLFKAKADERKLNLSVSIEKKIPSTLCGDPTRLSQILNNLVGNAIKFTEKGEVSIAISLRSQRDKNVTIDFEVKDSGIGIPKESIHSIFESFTQASSDTTRKFGGTGLGLTIVKRLIELQGGTISVKSKEGEGTTFCFHLAYEIAATESVQPKVSDDENEKSLGHLNILVAEDNAINQLIVKKILQGWNVNVVCAGNGLIAIEKLQERHFDLVLMDIQMPELDGYSATQRIRAELAEPFRSVPIMAMTAHAVPMEKQKCFDLGMNGYISKPFNPADLKKKIIELTEAEKIPVHSEENKISSKENIPVTNKTTANKPQTEIIDAKIDLTYLKEIAEGNEAFMIEMIEMFLHTTPEALEHMDECFKKQNWEELRLIAHRIKPSFAYMGLADTQKMLAEIETCSDSKTNLEKIPQLISNVHRSSESAFKELEKELGELK